MQVSARADYALWAAAELARAASEGSGPLKGERISEEQGIPKKFMEIRRAGPREERTLIAFGSWS